LDKLLPAIEIETAATPRFSLIWLHGLGADGSDFAAVVPELGLADSADFQCSVRFVFPHAPEMPVTCNSGYVMPSWYDIISLDASNRNVDEGGIVRARQWIRRLITRENQRGVPCARIFLAGFSQGGAIAYTTALTHPEMLAGVIALSTYIPSPQLLEREVTNANESVPIFAAHGSTDDVVSLELGTRARTFLTDRGYRVEWHQYHMSHSVCLEEIAEIGRWLKDRMAAS
jgi:phospholipase/carboxylesterase